jgi:hypothetical protein
MWHVGSQKLPGIGKKETVKKGRKKKEWSSEKGIFLI